MSIMEVKNVGYTYDNRRKVLRGINVQMEQGKLYAILGPSGCGKTTPVVPDSAGWTARPAGRSYSRIRILRRRGFPTTGGTMCPFILPGVQPDSTI